MQLLAHREDPPSESPWTLPPGSKLVHIGPPKTGSTALQAALYAARDDLARQGVLYAGRTRHPEDAIRAVMQRPSYRHRGKVPSEWAWTELVNEMRSASQPRVMLSSEFLAGAEPETTRRIADDLGRSSVHVVAALRPLASLMPSQWQQDVRRGARESFPDWMRDVLADDDTRAPYFWRTHRIDRILADWVQLLGADRVAVIVLDGADREFLYRSVEGILGVRPRTLVPDESVANRSLSYPETEAVRALNELCAEAGIDWLVHARVVHLGAAKELWRRPVDPSEPSIDLPAWAVDRALEIDTEMIDSILRAGVRMLGDPAGLLAPPARTAPAELSEVSLSPELGARLAMGVMRSVGLAPDSTIVPRRFLPSEPPGLAFHTTRQLAKALIVRGGRLVFRRARRVRWAVVGRRPGGSQPGSG